MKRLTALCYRSDARFAGCLLLCEPTLRTHENLAASNFACNEICVVERKLDPALESVRHVTALTDKPQSLFPARVFPDKRLIVERRHANIANAEGMRP